MSKQELIDALNLDMADEFASAIQYINHASLISGARFIAVQKELLTHASEEMQHAKTLAEQVAFLGGRPTVTVGPIHTSTNSEEMLEEDLEGEKAAVTRYKARIRAAHELGEFGLARVLQDILVMEEEHVRDLQSAVDRRTTSAPELVRAVR
ncbi:MAG TPA: ferritin-like domain-containing protein [Terriglobia bacterium]|nr:ferritin-like domain-containing protein [Terriglobia bacterium]